MATISQGLHAIHVLKLVVLTVPPQLSVSSVMLATFYLVLVVRVAKTLSQPVVSASTLQFAPSVIPPSTLTLLYNVLPAR